MEEVIGCKTTAGRLAINEGIQKWPRTLAQAHRRSVLFHSLRKDSENTKLPLESFERISVLEEGLEPLLRDSTEVEREGYSQVCFTGSPWSQLNSIPFALLLLSLYKAWVVPTFSILLPIVSLFLPFVMLKVFYSIPITFGQYTMVMWRMWNGQPLPRRPEEFAAVAASDASAPPVSALTRIKQLAQNGWTLFSFGQLIWQPIQQAKHFRKLDIDCLNLGSKILALKREAEGLLAVYGRWLPPWLSDWLAQCPSDARQAFAFVVNDSPFWLRHVLRSLGRFEVLVRLAARSDVVPARFVTGTAPVLMLRDFGDPAIPVERRKVSSIRLGGSKAHAVLTGPNRGGKSSFLRGILQNVQVAHAFGAAFAASAQMSHFDWIADGLRLDDTPGETSMFEREVAFSSGIVKKEGGRGLVLYDELFHSTNPPDAKRTSELFTQALWEKKNCVSVISTHIYELAHKAPAHVKQMCVAAWVGPKGRHIFSYTVQRGICEVSSVDLLLRQYGLLTGVSAAARLREQPEIPAPDQK